ncbi:PREDICTED: uncharacterized protein LOC108768290 [Trachymyrmex cornetzi]|uniref:Uncharacterized protein n=1 Tax=Trachymyrmex cornetzi TaxID=471704 RepID=A0A195DEN0_9HYME|nr:PREDICTED: uncharacterized protein LOC108768290 [Trachymyrmex cornetzi]KYN11297.1 hypothetical protein ALC57_16508 [Trachymyrmex cornetzi]
MYKTVRKGDASLQYTILPQTDQFSSGGFPQASSKPRPRIIKYTMATIMVLIILSCVATPFLMNQNDHNLFASTMRAISRVEPVRNTSRNQTKNVSESKNRGKISTVSTTEVTRRKDLEDGTTSFNVILRGEEEEEEAMVDDATLADTPEISTQVISSMETSTRDHQMTTTSALPSALTTVFSTSSTTSKVFSSGTTEDTKMLSTSKKPKMPRVTLKLRENETIPQMYVKAGIASYKKGNIATSVLASGLSLEGLIFKTPEGTIKPWPQKWFLGEPSDSDVKTWKVFAVNHIPMITVYAIFGGMCATACGLIALMIHVQRGARKAIRRAGQNIEEPEVEEHESTLLGAESQEIEEKE